MSSDLYSIQKKTPFAESLVWQLNKDFYQQNGIAVWSNEMVPHQITNSALAATTYAELIYAFLKDLELKEKTESIVYILELGAGHGRLSFNILEHLEKLISDSHGCSTNYCYVLSDIVEENLSFYSNHPRLQKYFNQGVLDVAFFDATKSQELVLRNSKRTIGSGDLDQPILAIANYFFDSLPNELFYFEDREVFNCSVSIDSLTDPEGKNAQEVISELKFTYHKTLQTDLDFDNEIFNQILTQYNQRYSGTYILFPKVAMECLSTISALSESGLVLLTMDKGYKESQELAAREQPDFVKHGSFSLWVNFHAISQFCTLSGGLSMFDINTNLSIDMGCLNFIQDSTRFLLFEEAYRKHSSQMNLDDVISLKRLVYKNLPSANLTELLGLLRLNAYDSSIFIKLLPSIKKLSKSISVKQRSRLKQTILQVWEKYYAIKEDYDLSYELGGLMYDLGYYTEALDYFEFSSDTFGYKVDVDYNRILCYYQLRQDVLFHKTLEAAKLRFPKTDAFVNLEALDMS